MTETLAPYGRGFGASLPKEENKAELGPRPTGDTVERGPAASKDLGMTRPGKVYVGTKLIRAQPMDAMEFQIQHGPSGISDRENEPGYEVTYAGEHPSDPVYISWSPKAIFENAYRKVTEAERKLF